MANETNHVQYADQIPNLTIWCQLIKQVTSFTQDHFDNYCTGCPYFAGTVQSQGIECKFYDGTSEPVEEIFTMEDVGQLADRMSGVEVTVTAIGKAFNKPNLIKALPTYKPNGVGPEVAIVIKQALTEVEKFNVKKAGKQVGVVTLNPSDLPLEVTSQDTILVKDVTAMIANPIEVQDGNNGTIYSSIGDIQFPDAVKLKLRELGYTLERSN